MTHRRIRTDLAWAPLVALACVPFAASATDGAVSDMEAMRAEISALRADQAERIAEMQRTEARLAALEAAMTKLEKPVQDGPRAGGNQVPSTPAAGIAPAGAARRDLQFSGDFRVRYEANSDPLVADDRSRGVIRGRLRAGYTLSDHLYLGGMLSTGDPSNPRTGDVTLTGFGADLQVKLAQAFLRGNFGGLQVLAGKMPQPFQRTELVWDGDVNPQGLAAGYRLQWHDGSSVRLTGLYSPVDEAAAGPDSDMIGGQLTIGHELAPGLRLEFATAYYDYSLKTAPGLTPAAYRGNLIAPGGGYLSDFDLFDAMATISYSGMGPRWPAQLVIDYVKNLDAAVSEDSGIELDLTLGRASERGDWRLMYGYSEAGVDAVLGAFSSDNTDLPTNYLQHTLAVDYVLAPRLTLNATAYHYRPKSALYAPPRPATEWIDRFRLNLQFAF